MPPVQIVNGVRVNVADLGRFPGTRHLARTAPEPVAPVGGPASALLASGDVDPDPDATPDATDDGFAVLTDDDDADGAEAHDDADDAADDASDAETADPAPEPEPAAKPARSRSRKK